MHIYLLTNNKFNNSSNLNYKDKLFCCSFFCRGFFFFRLLLSFWFSLSLFFLLWLIFWFHSLWCLSWDTKKFFQFIIFICHIKIIIIPTIFISIKDLGRKGMSLTFLLLGTCSHQIS